MRSIVRNSAIAGLTAFGGALLLVFGVAGWRFWPRISGQHLPGSLIWPFARPLLAAALEIAFLISVPIASGVVASARCARAAGTHSWRVTAWVTCFLVLGLGSFSFGVSSWLDGRGDSPGQLAAELISSARESCVESVPPAEVTVPMVGFAWICEAGHAPLIQGRAPLGKQATFQAAAIALSDDLKRIVLDGLTLAFPFATWQIHVHAKHATLNGLPPWGRARRLPFGLRVCWFTLSAALAGYCVGRLASVRSWLSAWTGALVGASVSGCLWWAMVWLERREPSASGYLVMPAAGLLGSAFAALSLLGVQWLQIRWRRN